MKQEKTLQENVIQNLESSFYSAEEQTALAQYRSETKKETLANEVVQTLSCSLDTANEFVALGLDKYTFIALKLLPLLLVAWSDGDVAKTEAKVIVDFAKESAGVSSSENQQVPIKFDHWLTQSPSPDALEHWKTMIEQLRECCSPIIFTSLLKEIRSGSKKVGTSDGGFLGLGSISSEELSILDEIDAFLKSKEKIIQNDQLSVEYLKRPW